MSSDGRTVQTGERACTDNTGDCFAGIMLFSRDPNTSALTENGAVVPRFNVPGDFTTGGNGIYQVETWRHAISSYIRTGDGDYRRTGCLTRRVVRKCRFAPDITKPRAVDLSENGTLLAVAGNGRVAMYSRNVKGRLRLRATMSLRAAPLREITQAEISTDGRSLYVVAARGAIASS